MRPNPSGGPDRATDWPASTVHPVVRVWAAWTWRLLIVAAGIALVGWLALRFDAVVIPVALALLASAFLSPLVGRLHRIGMPRAIAVVLTLLAGLAVLGAIVTFVVEQFVAGFPRLVADAEQTVSDLQDRLRSGRLPFTEDQVHSAGDTLVHQLQEHQSQITSGALSTATALGDVLAGVALTVFVTIFFLYGGAQVWHYVTKIVPEAHREKARAAGVAGFASLTGWMRGTTAVAAIDALAFVPLVGAFVAGGLAVIVALVSNGPLAAAIVLVAIVAIVQLEGHVLQPLLLGRAVQLHPLAVVLSITTGIVVHGIIGGLLAVPLVSLLNASIASLRAEEARDPDEPADAGDAPAAADDAPAAADEPEG